MEFTNCQRRLEELRSPMTDLGCGNVQGITMCLVSISLSAINKCLGCTDLSNHSVSCIFLIFQPIILRVMQ